MDFREKNIKVRVLNLLQDGRLKHCSFWLKFDVMITCEVLFNCNGLDCWLSLSTIHIWLFHLLVRSFPISLELSIIGDDVCYIGVLRMIFIMFCCCKPLV